jgi:hypothetical protein
VTVVVAPFGATVRVRERSDGERPVSCSRVIDAALFSEPQDWDCAVTRHQTRS